METAVQDCMALCSDLRNGVKAYKACMDNYETTEANAAINNLESALRTLPMIKGFCSPDTFATALYAAEEHLRNLYALELVHTHGGNTRKHPLAEWEKRNKNLSSMILNIELGRPMESKYVM